MPYRDLQHASADLDPVRDGGDDAHQHDRIERRAAPAKRVRNPQSGKPARFDLPRQIGDAVERAAGNRRIGPGDVDDMHFHGGSPYPQFSGVGRVSEAQPAAETAIGLADALRLSALPNPAAPGSA